MSALGLRSDYHGDADTVMAKECQEFKFETTTSIPYAYVSIRDDIKKLVALADLLGCSLDYLFCRTDNPGGMSSPATVSAGQTSAAWYPMGVTPDIGQQIIVMAYDGFAEDAVYEGAATLGGNAVSKWGDLMCWTPAPEGPTSADAPTTPAEGWLPLQWIPGEERPTKDKQIAVCKFMTDGMETPKKVFARWNELQRKWYFSKGEASIDAKCVGWFPLPED